MPVVIRRATAADVDAVLEMLAQLDDLHRANLPDLFRVSSVSARSRESVRSLLDDATCALFVAQSGGRLVGLVVVRLRETAAHSFFASRRFAEIDELFVAPDHRRQGYRLERR